MTSADTRRITVCSSAKGGQGCTTIAAMLALLTARDQPTLLLDTRGDAAAILGVREPQPSNTVADAMAQAVEASHQLRVAAITGEIVDSDGLNLIADLLASGHRVIVDTGTDHEVLHRFDLLRPQRLLVTRSCYIALRRAVGVPFVPDQVVLIADRQRALTEHDVSIALALPVVSVPYDPSVARAIDAGLLASRLPRCLTNPLAQVTTD